MKEKVNWWWYLFFAGIVIRVLYYFLAKDTYEFPSTRQLVVPGLNPSVGVIVTFIPILAVTIAFKTLGRLVIGKLFAILAWVVAGIVVMAFILYLPARHVEPILAQRRYYAGAAEFPNSHPWINYYVTTTILELLTFLFFFIRNFPARK